jgi:hypothetical protein
MALCTLGLARLACSSRRAGLAPTLFDGIVTLATLEIHSTTIRHASMFLSHSLKSLPISSFYRIYILRAWCVRIQKFLDDSHIRELMLMDGQLCSDCFVKMMYQRLSNPYLPDADFSGYLVEQFDDIQSVCSTTMALTTRALPTYPNVTLATPTPSATGNSTTPTCRGQMIPSPSSAMTCDQVLKSTESPRAILSSPPKTGRVESPAQSVSQQTARLITSPSVKRAMVSYRSTQTLLG